MVSGVHKKYWQSQNYVINSNKELQFEALELFLSSTEQLSLSCSVYSNIAVCVIDEFDSNS